MWAALGTLLLVAWCTLVFKIGNDPGQQAELFYCTQAAALAFFFVDRAVKSRAVFIAIGLYYAAFFEASSAVCGIGGYGIIVEKTEDLCISQYGWGPYQGVSIALAAYLVWHYRFNIGRGVAWLRLKLLK